MFGNDADGTARFLDALPAGLKGDVISQVLEKNIACAEDNAAAFQAMIGGMLDAGTFEGDEFRRLGAKIKSAAYEKVFLKDPALETSPELQSVFKGWVAQHPKESFETVAASARPGLVRPAFSAWLGSYPEEAAKWLGERGRSGALEEACMEEFHDYLASSSKKERVARLLEQLPPASRDSLKARLGIE